MTLPLTISAPGAKLAAMLHPAPGPVGAVIVSGAPQGRFGAHRGFANLARALARANIPTLRFDRRGLGDSDGLDPGFAAIAPDIAAARDALRAAAPAVRHVIGIGLCDGATALALDPSAFNALILLNPWTLDTDRAADLPPRAAVAARYRARALSPRAWLRLLSGRVNLRRAALGLFHLAREEPATAAARAIAARLATFDGPTVIVLAERDNTAQAFAALWRAPLFAPARARSIELVWLRHATHTFARDEDQLAARCVAFAAGFAARWSGH